MSLTVRQRAEHVATLRHIEVTLMEMLARWVPTTPSMETKVLFGRHIWETAQHADILGKRTYELRAPMNLTLPPVAEYSALLAEIASIERQNDRIMAFYDVLLPAVMQRCKSYIERTDNLLDEPTVRIARRIIADSEAMIEESRRLRNELPHLSGSDAALRETLAKSEGAIEEFVAGRKQVPVAEVSHA